MLIITKLTFVSVKRPLHMTTHHFSVTSLFFICFGYLSIGDVGAAGMAGTAERVLRTLARRTLEVAGRGEEGVATQWEPSNGEEGGSVRRQGGHGERWRGRRWRWWAAEKGPMVADGGRWKRWRFGSCELDGAQTDGGWKKER